MSSFHKQRHPFLCIAGKGKSSLTIRDRLRLPFGEPLRRRGSVNKERPAALTEFAWFNPQSGMPVSHYTANHTVLTHNPSHWVVKVHSISSIIKTFARVQVKVLFNYE